MKLDNAVSKAEIDQKTARLLQWQPESYTPLIWTPSTGKPSCYSEGLEVIIAVPGHSLNHRENIPGTHNYVDLKLGWELQRAYEYRTGWAVTFEGTTSADSARKVKATIEYNITHDLMISLTVTSLENEPFLLNQGFALNCSIGDIKDVTLAGVSGHNYLDLHEGISPKRLHTDAYFVGPTKMQFTDISTFELVDPRKRREVHFELHGTRSTTFWTPWNKPCNETSTRTLPDWEHFLRVETASAGSTAISLNPGQSHTVSATIELRTMV